MIAIIDYGMGNLRSVENAFLHLGYNAVVTDKPEVLAKADRVILPGVGAFGDCLAGLKESGLYDATRAFMDSGKPFLGICVGMQMLFEESTEFGTHKGIGIFNGSIHKFPDELKAKGMKVPHMGWNNISIQKSHPILAGIDDGASVYFVHSYYAPVYEKDIVASCKYGVDFAAMVVRDNIVATQFHPEKSQGIGLTILKNFGEWKC